VPQGFFDGVQNHYPPSPQLRRRSLVPSWGLRPRALLARLPQPFHRSQPNADESTELQQRPGPSTSPRRIPPIVEVPCIDDKKVCLVGDVMAGPSDSLTGTVYYSPAGNR
jgi:hypothetical protein